LSKVQDLREEIICGNGIIRVEYGPWIDMNVSRRAVKLEEMKDYVYAKALTYFLIPIEREKR
jgi:hypothetical protein